MHLVQQFCLLPQFCFILFLLSNIQRKAYNSGNFTAGYPEVELDLGTPLAPVEIIGDRYIRRFERGRVELLMGDGQYPIPFSYAIPQNGVIIDQFGEITISP